ncbi:peptide deformylase [Hansschlegelia plantiphila]|uniref:Peptide deformylase n=1 Tax=Hansschlegelia plantiphila TaxID=374655 RepID=A0A9W6J301_9HYPH|nr:peptide deformylase [Hansschlegelia plantiphila]GLK68841.1 peptide deformylase [Hansschlegelia plantiphila]
MAASPLVYLPDPKLRLVSAPVERVDPETEALVQTMFDTMYDSSGIGLAAIQIGVAKRVVTIDLAGDEEKPQPLVFINPEIVKASEELQVYDEGCLSIPEYFEEVERPARVTVRSLDREGKPQEIEAEGLLAVCIQHEIDHLNGVLFIDHISRLKRDRVTKKFEKARAIGELPSFPKRDKRDRRAPEPVAS